MTASKVTHLKLGADRALGTRSWAVFLKRVAESRISAARGVPSGGAPGMVALPEGGDQFAVDSGFGSGSPS